MTLCMIKMTLAWEWVDNETVTNAMLFMIDRQLEKLI